MLALKNGSKVSNNKTGNKKHLVIKVKNLLTVRSRDFENDFFRVAIENSLRTPNVHWNTLLNQFRLFKLSVKPSKTIWTQCKDVLLYFVVSVRASSMNHNVVATDYDNFSIVYSCSPIAFFESGKWNKNNSNFHTTSFEKKYLDIDRNIGYVCRCVSSKIVCLYKIHLVHIQKMSQLLTYCKKLVAQFAPAQY